MPCISHPSTVKKIGAIYSWLIRQPAAFAAGVQSIADAEKLYDGYAMLGVENIFDDYDPKVAIALIGYDPALIPMPPQNKKIPKQIKNKPLASDATAGVCRIAPSR